MKLQTVLTCVSVSGLFVCLKRREHSKIIIGSNKNTLSKAFLETLPTSV